MTAGADPLATGGGATARRTGRGASDRGFRYLMIAPAVLVILLIGLFPVIYTALKSVQNVNMFDVDTSYQGFIHYKALMSDERFWKALGHTVIFVVVALPLVLPHHNQWLRDHPQRVTLKGQPAPQLVIFTRRERGIIAAQLMLNLAAIHDSRMPCRGGER
mgnify:CR=1 FL=1